MINIKLYDGHAEVVDKDKMINKAISYPDLSRILSNSIGVDIETSLILPNGCYQFSIKKLGVSLSTYHPGIKREIAFDEKNKGKKFLATLPTPNLILVYHLSISGAALNVDEVKYFATSMSLEELKHTYSREVNASMKGIFIAPLPNIRVSGEMCFGMNSMPSSVGQNLRNLEMFFDVLWSTPFNDDYPIRGIRKKELSNAVSWVKHLSKLNSFPYDLLEEYN